MARQKNPSAPTTIASLDDRISACKNPQLAQWLREWWEEAAARGEGNKLQYVYKKAMESMILYPQQILQIKDAQKVSGIGPSIVSRLDKKFSEWKAAGGSLGVLEDFGSLSQALPSLPVPILEDDRFTQSQPNTAPKPKPKAKPRAYVPTYRSGPYGMLLALYIEANSSNSKGYCTRQDILSLGQPYCQVPFEEGTYSALRGAIKTLEDKELVSKWGNPSRWSLTDQGAELAEKLWNSGERRSSAPIPLTPTPAVTTTIPKVNAPIALDEEDSDHNGANSSAQIASFHWPPGTFDILLIVDNREVKSRNDRDYIINRLNESTIPCEQRSLELGDFLWIARKKPSHRLGNHDDIEEVVLDFVVERKTEDDLIHSIVDGRFMEQKFRLNSSAIGQCIYLVEKYEGADFDRVGMDKFQAAIWHTQIIDGLSLRYTANLEDSLRFICALHSHLVSQYQNQTLNLALCSDVGHLNRSQFMSSLHRLSQEDNCRYFMSYGIYSHINSKSGTLTLRDLFIKMLSTIRGMTAERALMIVEKFPTPFLLLEHYKSLPDDDSRRDYFKDWCYGQHRRKFGLQLSRRVFILFWEKTYPTSGL